MRTFSKEVFKMIYKNFFLAPVILMSVFFLGNRGVNAQPAIGIVAKPIIRELETAILNPARSILPPNVFHSIEKSATVAATTFINLAGIAFDAEGSHRVVPADLMTAELNPDGLTMGFIQYFGNPSWEDHQLPTYGRESVHFTRIIRSSLEIGRVAGKWNPLPGQQGRDYFDLTTKDTLRIIFRSGLESAERGFNLAAYESGKEAFSRSLKNLYIILRLIDTTLAESSFAIREINLINANNSQALLSEISRLGVLIADTWKGLGQEETYIVLAADTARTYMSILNRLELISAEGKSPIFPDLTIRSYHDILTMLPLREHFPVIGDGIIDIGGDDLIR
jgi:hypothetical protein